jgi:hypothetical protein
MWQMLPMYPGMIEGNVHRTSRGNQALLGKEYKSSVNYETLKSFYTENLTQSGWKFLREKQVKDWGRDLGGRELEFQKGEYILDIQYSGEKANYGWQYTIDIDWDASRAPL